MTYRESGRGRPLVLLHGWSMSSAVFAEALSAFSNDYRVLAPDLRGHGDSEAGPGYRLADLTGDIRQWMEGLELDGVLLLGWSLGGQVAMELAKDSPVRIQKLILQSTTPRFTSADDWDAGLPPGQVRAMMRDLNRNYRKTMGDFFAMQFAQEEMPRDRFWKVVDFAVREGKLPPVDVALAVLETLARENQCPDLHLIDLPVLVVHGELDRITPTAAGRYLADRIAGSRYTMIEGCGHAPFLSLPEQVFSTWWEFLK